MFKWIMYICIAIAVLLIVVVIHFYTKKDFWKDPRDIDPDPYE